MMVFAAYLICNIILLIPAHTCTVVTFRQKNAFVSTAYADISLHIFICVSSHGTAHLFSHHADAKAKTRVQAMEVI